MNDFSVLVDNLSHPLRSPYRKAWGMILSLVILTIIMWSFNLKGWNTAVGITLFLGLLLMKFFGFRPTNLVLSAFAGGLNSTLRGQGFAPGATRGVSLLYRVVLAVCLGFLIVGSFLVVMPVVHAPGAYFAGIMGLYGLLIASEVSSHSSWPGKWKIINGYFAIIFVGSMLTLVNASPFDEATGEPTHMGYYIVNAAGDAEFFREFGKTPKDCRPEGVKHVGFSYVTDGLCFSSKTGARLIPEPAEAAHWRDPKAVATEAWGLRKQISLPASCPEDVITVQPGKEFTLPAQCEIVIAVPLPPEQYQAGAKPRLRYDIAPGQKDLDRRDNIYEYQTDRDTRPGQQRIVPKKDKFPAGVTEIRYVVSWVSDLSQTN